MTTVFEGCRGCLGLLALLILSKIKESEENMHQILPFSGALILLLCFSFVKVFPSLFLL
jgi:hypothetical protein